MTVTTPTAALWPEIIVLGFCCLLIPIMAVVVALTHPPYALWPFALSFSTAGVFDWLGLLGVCLVVIGLWIGMRNEWKWPASGSAKAR
jgi:protein-S-isoprenylcysteine O-methyltransferase Ste14